MTKIDIGKSLHCCELSTGKNLTGTILLTEERISAQIYSFADHFYLEDNLPIFLLSETNDIISLHSNITAPPGTHSRFANPQRRTYRQDILSNIAVFGHDAWKTTDLIKRVTFRVNHTEQLMRHREKVDALGREKYPEDETFNLFEDFTNGMTISARYAATYGMNFDAPEDFWPTFEIEFDVSQTIDEYINHVLTYVQFLSFCLGIKLKPSDIQIDRLSRSNVLAAIETREYLGHHAVYYIWPEAEVDEHDLWVGGSPVRAWDAAELSSFRASIILWMNRANEWKKSYTLMNMSFGLRNTMSSDRLIGACRWFEEIPGAHSNPAISDDDIEEISAAASAKAIELGYTPLIQKRIAGSIKRIKLETAEQHFSRLLATIEGRFGERIMSKNAVTDLKRAIALRGQSAHGHFSPKDDDAFRSFAKSVRAMEALCYLLTALDLPLNEAGVKRLHANPLVRDYHLSHE